MKPLCAPIAVEVFMVSLCLDKHIGLDPYKSCLHTHTRLFSHWAVLHQLFLWDSGSHFKFKLLHLGDWTLSFLLSLSSCVVFNSRTEMYKKIAEVSWLLLILVESWHFCEPEYTLASLPNPSQSNPLLPPALYSSPFGKHSEAEKDAVMRETTLQF